MNCVKEIQPKGKILYVTSRFPALSMTFVANEMAGVQHLGYDVHVCTIWDPLSNHNGHPAEIQFLNKVVTTQLKSASNWAIVLGKLVTNPGILLLILQLIPGHLKSPWLFAKLLAAIPKGILAGSWAKKNDIKWIHAHFLTTPTTVALIASKISKIPFSATAHAFDITSKNPRITNGSVPLKCKEADAIVTISNYNKDDILTRWPELKEVRLEVIYNGIDTAAFSPRDSTTTLTEKRTKQILSVSNLNAKKGFYYLIKAAGILLDRDHDIVLDIYGEGPERARLESLIEELGRADKIKLHGSVNQAQVAALCSDTDIFALASIPLESGDADGLPTVLIESLAVEIPTVSTQVTGIPEIIIDGVTGMCVPPADAKALADALEWILIHPKEAADMGRKGRELVLSKFDKYVATAHLDSLWQELLLK